jgi:hypothetical protein
MSTFWWSLYDIAAPRRISFRHAGLGLKVWLVLVLVLVPVPVRRVRRIRIDT